VKFVACKGKVMQEAALNNRHLFDPLSQLRGSYTVIDVTN